MAPLTEAPENIQIRREYEPFLNDMAEFVRGGGLRQAAIDNARAREEFGTGIMDSGENPSHYGKRGRHQAFMDPVAARQLALEGGDPSRYLGGRTRQDFKRAMQFNQPAESDIHVDALLTEISVAYQSGDMIGAQVFPRVQVTKPSDLYFIFDPAPGRRDEGTALVRGLSARAARGGYTVSTDKYLVERYTFEHPIDDDQYDAADSPINLDTIGAEFCTAKIDLRLEKIVASLVFTAANWTNNAALSGTARWDSSAGHPMTDFKTARLAINKATGRRPNTLVIGVEAFEVLSLHADLIERIKYTGTQQNPAMVTPAMIAALAGVDRVLVGMCVENTAVEQLPDVQTTAFIWGKAFWMGYVAPTPARETPSAGYIFTKGRRADRYREERITSDIIRCQESFDVKKTADLSGYMLDTIIS